MYMFTCQKMSNNNETQPLNSAYDCESGLYIWPDCPQAMPAALNSICKTSWNFLKYHLNNKEIG